VQPFDSHQIPHLFLDEVQDAGHFGFFAFEVIQRKYPDGENLDSQFVAPMEYVFELIRAVMMPLNYIRESVLGGVAAVAVKNHADMVGDIPATCLPLQPPLIKVVEYPFYTSLDKCPYIHNKSSSNLPELAA